MCVQAGTSISKLATKIGTTPQNLYKRLQTGKMSYEELSTIANALGYTFNYSFTPTQVTETKLYN